MSSKGNNINRFWRQVGNKGKEGMQVQTAWVVAKEIDWVNKTMLAEGITDSLDYEGVLLGVGNDYRKPTEGSLCLVGLIENNPATAFLIEAEKVEESIATVGESVLTTKPEGFEIRRNGETLQKVLEDFIQELQNVIVVQGTSPNIPALEAIKTRLKQVLI